MERGDSDGNNLWADRVQEYDDGCQGHQRESALRPSEADGRRPSDRETGMLRLSSAGDTSLRHRPFRYGQTDLHQTE